MPDQQPVLIVDDDPVFISLAVSILNALGINRIRTAKDGAEGIEVLRGSPKEIGLIFLDLKMPKLDGLAFMRAAGVAGFSGDIVITSGESDKVIRSALTMGRMLGVSVPGSLTKPLRVDEVSAVLDRCNAAKADSEPAAGEDDATEIRKEMLVPFYQPQYRTADGSIIGAEALTRIDIGNGRHLAPSGFFQEIAQSRGATVVAKHIVRRVYADIAEWKKQGLSTAIAINLDASVLERWEFVPALLAITEENQIPPEAIVLELTETALARDISHLLEALTRLSMAGFGLSLDDYGTGGSNFELLKMCPFTEVKIDLSIIQAMTHDPLSMQFVEKTARFAQDLDLRIVAEGIETQEQLTSAREHGVHVVQGFLFSRAISSADFGKLLAGQVPEDVAV